ncbi:MAG: hypothetical protein A2X86_02310 [Bdellovibrionales bacterium GWA2_49_15]|nr:MAG: hypothetical protein A2X86_02310 [Bdellovibrionales bacterium GWA2_49_15]
MKTSTQNLHQKLLTLVKQERVLLTQILDHLAEINRGKLFLEFKCDSLLKYCIQELGYSESAAYRRIKALRITEEIPETKTAIQNGELNLSQLSMAQGLFESARN